MAVTRLKRKARRNRTIAKSKKVRIKLQNSKPVIRRIDIQGIIEEFNKAPKAKTPKIEEKIFPEADVAVKVEKTEKKKSAEPKKVKKETVIKTDQAAVKPQKADKITAKKQTSGSAKAKTKPKTKKSTSEAKSIKEEKAK